MEGALPGKLPSGGYRLERYEIGVSRRRVRAACCRANKESLSALRAELQKRMRKWFRVWLLRAPRCSIIRAELSSRKRFPPRGRRTVRESIRDPLGPGERVRLRPRVW